MVEYYIGSVVTIHVEMLTAESCTTNLLVQIDKFTNINNFIDETQKKVVSNRD